MKIEYLNIMPEIANKYDIALEAGEKVVFTALLKTFGTEKDSVLGNNGSKFTLTNQRIIADNGLGTWTVDIAKDISECKKVEYKHLFGLIKGVYFSVNLNKEVAFHQGTRTLTGYHFYFDKEDTTMFEEITNNL